MPRTRTRKGGRRKRGGGVGLVPKTLRKAIAKVNKAARSAARSVDGYALIKAPKMVLGPILKSRLGGRKHKGGGTSCCKRLNPGSVSSSTQKKGGRKRRGGSKKRRGGSRRGGSRKRR